MPCPHCGQAVRRRNGLYLKELRERAGIDQRTFGKGAGVSGPYISDIERNRRECPEDLLIMYLQLKSPQTRSGKGE